MREYSGDKQYDRFCEILESYAESHGYSKEYMRDVEFSYADHLKHYRDGNLSMDECRLGFLAACIRHSK